MDNSINVIGNLTKEPELRFTSTGQAVANLGLAVNSRFMRNGAWESKVTYFNVVAWGQLGENVAGSTKKGDRLAVSGRIEQRSYTTSGGDERTVYELIATDISVSLKFATVGEITKVSQRAGATATEAPAADEAAADEPLAA